MDKLKRQFSELRNSMPKYVQWLLLAAAFIVVLILLTLLLTGHKDNDAVKTADSEPVEINISNDNIDWSETRVGDKKSASIKITASAPARVSVRMAKEIAGLNARRTCNGGEVTANIPCTISLDYAPTAAMDVTAVPIFVDYRASSEPEELNITEKIMLTLGAVSPEPEKPVAPIKVPELTAPEKTAEPAQPTETFATPEPDEPKPAFQNKFQMELAEIAPSDPFAGFTPFEEPTVDIAPAAEKCSDFAFPGYNTSGNQAGWIKPERGGYYFHPFSDTNCDSPTGIYNPDTGIITDIRDNGKKIGTDAEHIGYSIISVNAEMPQLADSPRSAARAGVYEFSDDDIVPIGGFARVVEQAQVEDVMYATSDPGVVMSTQPYDRSFILRQYKPIPATIVSDVRADATLLNGEQFLPVRATVDRNVYSDNGRTIIIPTGTLLLGYVTGDVPGPYKAIGRMEIKWYQFVLPNGVEFNFGDGQDPFSGDSQGRIGVPGRGSTDYLEQFVMPMLTAIVPAAVNMIAPVADKFVNQIDLDNNTVVQSGTVRSSELAKNEIITAWNQVAQKLMVDMMDNTVPPFTIPAGTRITVYSPNDLAVVCNDQTKKCSANNVRAPNTTGNGQRRTVKNNARPNYADDSWVGQVRSFNWSQYCENGRVKESAVQEIYANGLSYSNVLFYCQTNQYQAINNARQDAMFQAQQNAFANNYGSAYNTGDGIWGTSNQGSSLTGIVGDAAYNENVLGLVADENGYLSLPKETPPAEMEVLTCLDGSLPDGNGCCAGEEYTFIEEYGDNFCCPLSGGDCFPPIK